MFFSKKLEKFKNLKHCFFSRKNGVSKGYYESLNCGLGSRDEKTNVLKNLKFVSEKMSCDEKFLITLNQKHSNQVIHFKNEKDAKNKLNGDAIVCEAKNIGISILAADCAPILVYEKKKKIVGCIHAGWQGSFDGIIENSIKKLQEMGGDPKELYVSIGPCISKKSYEVKKDFYLKFLKKSEKYEAFFHKKDDNSFEFDLREFINKKFEDLGILKIDNVKLLIKEGGKSGVWKNPDGLPKFLDNE